MAEVLSGVCCNRGVDERDRRCCRDLHRVNFVVAIGRESTSIRSEATG